MANVNIEFSGADAGKIERAAADFLELLPSDKVGVGPGDEVGTRDGGLIAFALAILGGAASIATIVEVIKSFAQKTPNVTIIIVNAAGERRPAVDLTENDISFIEAKSVPTDLRLTKSVDDK